MDRAAALFAVAAIGLMSVVAASQGANDSSMVAEPVPLSEISNQSRYHDQMEFINRFLLSAANATDNDTPNDLQAIPVVPVPSVIDELPVQPRFPRRSGGRGRDRHRHSTRVDPNQPARILLPPIVNYDSANRIPPAEKSIPSPQTERSVAVTENSTPTTAITETRRFEAKAEESATPGSGPQHRRVFIPPPLRFLLPPFFYENYISAQQTTTVSGYSPVTIDYVPEFKTNDSFFAGNQTETSTRFAPIIVIDTVSEPEDIKAWDRDVYFSIEYTTQNALPPHNPRYESVPNSNRIQLENTTQYTGYNEISNFHSDNTEPYNEKTSWPVTERTTQSTETYRDNRYEKNLEVNRDNRYEKNLEVNKQTTFSPRSTEQYPFLTGPNVEQTLFETGEFYSVDASKNKSTVAMMNKPLLSREVADAGMKITANLKEEQVREDKLSRGKLKYNHFKQFKFNDDDARDKADSDGLKVAESSYYDSNRRSVTQANSPDIQEFNIQAIPGSPGRDYPTLSKPPAGTRFSCHSVTHHRGYVADPSTGCQVFYICVGNGPGEAMLCPNGTLFSQDFLVCDWWYNVDCRPLAET